MTLLTLTDLPPELLKVTTRQVLIPGQILLQQGEPAKNIYWLAKGQLRLVSFVNQQMVTHYFVEAGEFLAETAMHFPTYGCTAIAEVRAEVIAIPQESFAQMLLEYPALANQYLANITYRFFSTKKLLELRSINSARDRLLYYLKEHLAPGETTMTLRKPLKAIASDLALTPEGLSRLLSRLQAEGSITRKKRSISLSEETLTNISNWYKIDLS